MRCWQKGDFIMRCWHKALIPYLPRYQLLGQWRECCCIAKNIAEKGTPNHILVNKIMDYSPQHFHDYTLLVYEEMKNRGYKCDWNKFSKWNIGDYQEDFYLPFEDIFFYWHTHRYLKQCLYNLEEKYDCGAIPKKEWTIIYDKLHYRNN